MGSDDTWACASSATPTRSSSDTAVVGLGLAAGLQADAHVVGGAQRREELEALEGPGQAEPGPPVRSPCG